jgi:endoglucanase
VALAWLGDLMGLWKEWGWGYSMWNFEGSFGIIGHGRKGAHIENVMGYDVDRDMLDVDDE